MDIDHSTGKCMDGRPGSPGKALGFVAIICICVTACSGINKDRVVPDNAADQHYKKELSESREMWFITPEKARDLVQNEAQVLDARHYAEYALSHVSGARHISWKDFVQEGTGLLVDRSHLLDLLLDETLRPEGSIVVYGAALEGWGEEGRIAWMLRKAGFAQTYIVNGGFEKLHPLLGLTYGPAAGEQEVLPKNSRQSIFPGRNSRKGITDSVDISNQELNDIRQKATVIVIDGREQREYLGQTPYGETRGGHIPGAIHIYFKDFLRKDGRILSLPELKELLISYPAVQTAIENLRQEGSGNTNRSSPDSVASSGSDIADEEIQRLIFVSYCTGGVRSAFITAVLRHHGLDARNYSGGMWQWSRGSNSEFPLIAGQSDSRP